jgi:hypothetical protein
LSKAAQINEEIEKSRDRSQNRSRSGASIHLSVATSITDKFQSESGLPGELKVERPVSTALSFMKEKYSLDDFDILAKIGKGA